MAYLNKHNVKITYTCHVTLSKMLVLTDICNICEHKNIPYTTYHNAIDIKFLNYNIKILRESISIFKIKLHHEIFSVIRYMDSIFKIGNYDYHREFIGKTILLMNGDLLNNSSALQYNYKDANAILYKHNKVLLTSSSCNALEEMHHYLYIKLTLPSILTVLFKSNSYFSYLPYELLDVILSFTH